MEYPNVTMTIGTVISHRLATLGELSTVLSTEDVYSLLEIHQVDHWNNRPRNP